MAKTLKDIAIELLEKYEASETSVIYEYSTNIKQSEKLLKTEIDKYRKAIDKAEQTEPTMKITTSPCIVRTEIYDGESGEDVQEMWKRKLLKMKGSSDEDRR